MLKSSVGRTAIIIGLAGITSFGALAPASAFETSSGASSASNEAVDESAVDKLGENVKVAAESGEEGARESYEAYLNLSEEQRGKLNEIINGEGVIAAAQDPNSGVTVDHIDCGVEGAGAEGGASAPGLAVQAAAATYNVTSRCDQDFNFAGINITKIRLSGDYQTGSGRVLATYSATPQVVVSREPGANISFSNTTHRLGGGQGYFQTTVTVERSLFGWNHSTRSANLQLVTNGPGVVSCGWR
ncbi:hypothetical protein NBM05_01885 [Rothia sp. AR01]|uniref:Secreted protein n=1 Tax=Rothia santali TaxID=2949643 RepID=A0A9X2HBT7_9MICC|nr:hypothetical protein [Rothia santali]MCP3424812.1 hypothetical protein [Rothia santali]